MQKTLKGAAFLVGRGFFGGEGVGQTRPVLAPFQKICVCYIPPPSSANILYTNSIKFGGEFVLLYLIFFQMVSARETGRVCASVVSTY